MMPCCKRVILFQVLLVAFACIVLTEAAPRQQGFPSTDAFWEWFKERIESFPQGEVLSDGSNIHQSMNDELKEKIQSVIGKWKPGDYREDARPEIRQRMESLVKQMEASGSKVSLDGSVPNSSEVEDFFGDMEAAISQKIQDLLKSVRDLLSEETSLNSASGDDNTQQVENLIDEITEEVRHEIDIFLQEVRDDLNDMADSFPQVSREDVEKIMKEITDEAESQIGEWMKEIQGLFDNLQNSVAVHERMRHFINQRTSMNNAKITREEMLKRFQPFITQIRSNPSTRDFDFDVPNATEWKDFFNKTSREIRQQFEDFLDSLQDSFDDLRHFNFTDIDFDMGDFIDDFVNETRQRFDQFLKEVQEAFENVPDYLKPPSREEIRNFFNETFHEVCEQMRQTIDEIRDFLEKIFGINTDNESTTAQGDDDDENKTMNTIDFLEDLSERDSSFPLPREDSDVFVSADDDSLSLAVDHGSEGDGKSSNSIGTAAIVLICVGVASGCVVAGVVVRRRMMGRKKMYKHVNSPSAAKLQAASLKAMAHSSHEYGTYEEASLKSANT